jgi:hypothetical protein
LVNDTQNNFIFRLRRAIFKSNARHNIKYVISVICADTNPIMPHPQVLFLYDRIWYYFPHTPCLLRGLTFWIFPVYFYVLFYFSNNVLSNRIVYIWPVWHRLFHTMLKKLQATRNVFGLINKVKVFFRSVRSDIWKDISPVEISQCSPATFYWQRVLSIWRLVWSLGESTKRENPLIYGFSTTGLRWFLGLQGESLVTNCLNHSTTK